MFRFKISTRTLVNGALSFLALAAIIALFFAYRGHARIAAPRLPISIEHLPYYAFCSFDRMLAAYFLALVFSIVYGMAAARGGIYERVMIPAIDIAQSVPVVGFFPAAVYFFVALANGSRFGVEMAAVFLIFTSQAWNMALGVFEAVKTIPADSAEALDAFGARGWLKFKRLLLPACMPKLVYNSILSWVAGWYFLIACEIITVGPANYHLPGLGSFLMDAANRGDKADLIAGLLALLAIIVAMDTIVWQPLSSWAEKFKYEFAASSGPAASLGMFDALAGIGPAVTRMLRLILVPPLRAISSAIERIPRVRILSAEASNRAARIARNTVIAIVVFFSGWAIAAGLLALARTLAQPWPADVRLIPSAIVASTIRMILAYLISLAWTLPVALAAGESPRFNRILSPVAEIIGSMPATALFPLIVLFVIRVTGGMNLASILLILTGMQWYLLFNLLAGINQVPEDLKEAARAFGLSRFARWRKLTIPAVMPSLITGSITAWGGGWNALILSEYFVYQGHTYEVLGLGALLDAATYKTGNGVMILLSLLSMIAVVIMLNRLIWRRLYDIATERYRLDY
ncbi:MAG: ABC transporter permease subunit [Candidatus Binatus sp.]|uniref:ABC transporter permease subunit n=1 Tax=Candidatus Binatus sp. TaxID=2811406 RepID=UPI00271C5B02|nr:ABC transporter permease subunit [Candidatus Binatus sp.]MDO8432583.1 ABC transporter permease subunit [Candidatus Binatus sp.]